MPPIDDETDDIPGAVLFVAAGVFLVGWFLLRLAGVL